MVIIFYDSEKEQLYICTEREKMKTISINDPDIMTHVPNDDILYVQNAHFITKKQFGDWLEGDGEILNNEPHRFTGFMEEPSSYSPTVEKMTIAATQYENSKFIHPAHHGAILIGDIKTPKYPHGVELVGKYDFANVEDLGGFDALDESHNFKWLLAKGKIEVVGYDYVKKYQGKKKQVSAADAELERILVPGGAHAEAVAAAGGIGNESTMSSSDPIELYITE